VALWSQYLFSIDEIVQTFAQFASHPGSHLLVINGRDAREWLAILQ